MCSELDIIINCKQTSVTEEKLNVNLLTNVQGTLMLHKLAQECPKLLTFVHVSSAYVNADKPGGMIEEKVYTDNTKDWRELFNKIMKMEGRDMRANTK